MNNQLSNTIRRLEESIFASNKNVLLNFYTAYYQYLTIPFPVINKVDYIESKYHSMKHVRSN